MIPILIIIALFGVNHKVLNCTFSNYYYQVGNVHMQRAERSRSVS